MCGVGEAAQEFIVTDCPCFPQNGNPSVFGVGNIAAQPRSMQQPPAQPLNSSQPNPRAQVPPPLLSPQVGGTENTLCVNCLNAAQEVVPCLLVLLIVTLKTFGNILGLMTPGSAAQRL